MVNLQQLLKTMIEKNASDLHITSGVPPVFRINKRIIKVKGEALSPDDTKNICFSILTDRQKQHFENRREIDISFGVKGIARFRANFYMQRGSVAGAFRKIPYQISTLDDLGLPGIVPRMIDKPGGLILVTGHTGSGRSSTLAAMIDHISKIHRYHIVTIEDPIEYLYNHNNSIINQREVRIDTEDFKTAIDSVVRQDPDVLLVGEIKSVETMEAVMNIAETGTLVFSSLHTQNAYQTLVRFIGSFPADQQGTVRQVLSYLLEGVVSQCLVERADGRGLVIAYELMYPTPAIRNLILEDNIHLLYSQMQLSEEAKTSGMITMNQCLLDYVKRGIVTKEAALLKSPDKEELSKLFTSG